MSYIKKMDRQIVDWELAPERKRMSLARWPSEFTGCHGKVEFMEAIGLYQCRDTLCGHSFDPLKGLEKYKFRLPYNKLASIMQYASKYGKDVSARAIAESVGVSLPTTYRVLRALDELPEFDLRMGSVRPGRPTRLARKPEEYPKPEDDIYERGGYDRLMAFAKILEEFEPHVPTIPPNEEKMLHSAFKWAAKKAREHAQSSLKLGGSNKYSTTYSHHKPLNPDPAP